MNFLNKMERKFGRFAIPNLTFWLIGAWVLGFIIQYTMPKAQSLLTMEPYLILQGQAACILDIDSSGSQYFISDFFSVLLLFYRDIY